MFRKLLIILALCGSFASTEVAAGQHDVVTWVDDNGVTHFGNAQFAPAGLGDAVEIEPANGMVPADDSVLHQAKRRTPMKVTTLQRTRVQNPRGWRGFDGRTRSGGRSSRSGGHRAR